MRTIAVLNPKGGCGKTTLATSLAADLSYEGKVTLVDMDIQRSSADWAKARTEDYPEIDLIVSEDGHYRAERDTDFVVIDAPAATHGKDVTALVRRAGTLVVPMLPSPIDMRAAYRFLDELLKLKAIGGSTKVGIVANRINEQTIIYREFSGFLDGIKVPIVAQLRETQNYIKAAERGLGITEMPPYLAWKDHEQWEPLLKWMHSRRSMPK